jgi:hypothetical protein
MLDQFSETFTEVRRIIVALYFARRFLEFFRLRSARLKHEINGFAAWVGVLRRLRALELGVKPTSIRIP